MERVQDLIDKLYQQRQRNESAAQLMVTVQQLHDALLSATQKEISAVSGKVAVVLPPKMRVAAQPAAVAPATPVPEAPPPVSEMPAQPAVVMPASGPLPEVKPVVQEPVGQPEPAPVAAPQAVVVSQPPPPRPEYILQKPAVAEAPAPAPIPVQPEPQPQAVQPPAPAAPPVRQPQPEPEPVREPLPVAQAAPTPPPAPLPQSEYAPKPQPQAPPEPQPNLFDVHFDAMEETPTLLQQTPKLPPKEIHELISEHKESLNDRLKQERPELSHMLKETPIKDLRKAIGVNDKFQFINELFRGDEAMYERSIKTINNFHILPEAEYWINRELKVKLGWIDSRDVVQHFYHLVKRRFS